MTHDGVVLVRGDCQIMENLPSNIIDCSCISGWVWTTQVRVSCYYNTSQFSRDPEDGYHFQVWGWKKWKWLIWTIWWCIWKLSPQLRVAALIRRRMAVPSLVWWMLLHYTTCHTDYELRVWPRLNGTTALVRIKASSIRNACFDQTSREAAAASASH